MTETTPLAEPEYSDPRDLPAIYFWFTHDLFRGRVRCDRCGGQSPEPTENDLAISRVQVTWGGYPVTGTQAAMEAWADRHEDQCPKVREWERQAAERERERIRALNPGVRGLLGETS